jgi:hypothetical protein
MENVHLEIDFILVFLALMKWSKKTSKKRILKIQDLFSSLIVANPKEIL